MKLRLNFGTERLKFKRKTQAYCPKPLPRDFILFILPNDFNNNSAVKLRQDELDDQDAETEDQELTRGTDAGIAQGGIEG